MKLHERVEKRMMSKPVVNILNNQRINNNNEYKFDLNNEMGDKSKLKSNNDLQNKLASINKRISGLEKFFSAFISILTPEEMTILESFLLKDYLINHKIENTTNLDEWTDKYSEDDLALIEAMKWNINNWKKYCLEE